jgi:hypothetical protein
MNDTGITPSVPFHSKGGKLFSSFGAESVIMDQLINLSDMEGMMQFSLLAFLYSIWMGLPLINVVTAVVQKRVQRICFKLISIPIIKLPLQQRNFLKAR